MNTTQILNGLVDDEILAVVSTEWSTDEARFEMKNGMIRVVELLGPARWFNPLFVAVQRVLTAAQEKAWEDEDGWDGFDHTLSDQFASASFALTRQFHPICISQRAMTGRRS